MYIPELTKEEVEALLDWTEGDTSRPACDPDDEGLCTVCNARAKLRSALESASIALEDKLLAVHEFLGQVTAWEGGHEDEHAEAREALEEVLSAISAQPTREETA